MENTFLYVRKPAPGLCFKRQIISQFAEELDFPEYWKANWDSFEECLRDKVEESHSHLNVCHVKWTSADFEQLEPYIQILEDLRRETSKVSYFTQT